MSCEPELHEDDSEYVTEGGERRLSRTLTQRYDMHSLRALQDLEVVIYDDLIKLCKCSEDDLPVELDLLMVYNAKDDDRLALLTTMLQGAPGDNTLFIKQILDKLSVIEDLSNIAKAELEVKASQKLQK